MSVSIDFKHYRLESINFNVRDFESTQGTNSHINMNVVKNNEILQVRLSFRMSPENNADQELLFVSFEGVFGITESDNASISDADLQKYGHVECAEMLFPALREFIADLTRRAGLEPLIIRTLDFAKLYQQHIQ